MDHPVLWNMKCAPNWHLPLQGLLLLAVYCLIALLEEQIPRLASLTFLLQNISFPLATFISLLSWDAIQCCLCGTKWDDHKKIHTALWSVAESHFLYLFRNTYRTCTSARGPGLGWLLFGFSTFLPAAKPLLPNSYQPRQNWADSGILKIQVNPTKSRSRWDTLYRLMKCNLLKLFSSENL